MWYVRYCSQHRYICNPKRVRFLFCFGGWMGFWGVVIRYRFLREIGFLLFLGVGEGGFLGLENEGFWLG